MIDTMMTIIHCDRGNHDISGGYLPQGTVGFYCVEEGTPWHKYAYVGEKKICDLCMWKDDNFLKDYPYIRKELGDNGSSSG